MILRCPQNCKDDYQDQKYKQGFRVYTEPGAGGKDGCRCTCTVCGHTMDYGTAKKLAQ